MMANDRGKMFDPGPVRAIRAPHARTRRYQALADAVVAGRGELASPSSMSWIGLELDDLQLAHHRRQPEVRDLAHRFAEQRASDRRRHRDVTFLELDRVAEHQIVRFRCRRSSDPRARPWTRGRRGRSGICARSIDESLLNRSRSWPSRACTNCCRSSAALYSLFSRRSPSSTAFRISLGSVTLSSYCSFSTSSPSFCFSASIMIRCRALPGGKT